MVTASASVAPAPDVGPYSVQGDTETTKPESKTAGEIPDDYQPKGSWIVTRLWRTYDRKVLAAIGL